MAAEYDERVQERAVELRVKDKLQANEALSAEEKVVALRLEEKALAPPKKPPTKKLTAAALGEFAGGMIQL